MYARVCARVCVKSFDQLTISKCNFAHCQAAHMPHADIPRKIVEQPIRTANICFLHTVNWCSSLCLTIGIYEISTSKVVGFFSNAFFQWWRTSTIYKLYYRRCLSHFKYIQVFEYILWLCTSLYELLGTDKNNTEEWSHYFAFFLFQCTTISYNQRCGFISLSKLHTLFSRTKKEHAKHSMLTSTKWQ